MDAPERPRVANDRTAMRIFDAHLDSVPRDDDDLDNLSWFDTVDALVVPGPRGGLERADDLLARLDALIDEEGPRLSRHGVRTVFAFGVHPTARPRRAWDAAQVEIERRVMTTPEIRAVGEIGFVTGDADEWRLAEWQLALAGATGRAAVARLPMHDRLGVARRLVTTAAECGLPAERLIVGPIDYTVFRGLADAGATGSIHLGDDALDVRDAADLVARFGSVARRRLVIGTATRSGPFDVLAAARLGSLLTKRGVDDDTIDAVLYRNAAARFRFSPDR